MSGGVVRVAERRGRVMTVLPCVCLEGGPMYMMAGTSFVTSAKE